MNLIIECKLGTLNVFFLPVINLEVYCPFNFFEFYHFERKFKFMVCAFSLS